MWQAQDNGLLIRQDFLRPEIYFFKVKDELFKTEEFKVFSIL